MAFEITTGNKADNNQALLKHLFYKLEGTCFGDKGYLTKLWVAYHVYPEKPRVFIPK